MSHESQESPFAGLPDDVRQRIEQGMAIDNFFYRPTNWQTDDPGEITSRKILVEGQMEKMQTPVATVAGHEKALRERRDFEEYAFEIFEDESETTTQGRIEFYLGQHTDEYVELLEGFASQVKPDFDQAEVVVPIAARNEVDIKKAIEVIREKAGVRCHFIVFDNYSVEDANAEYRRVVKTELDQLDEHGDVSVISFQTPDFSNVGFAKKIAMDLSQATMLERRHFPLMFAADADVVDYEQDEFLAEAIGILKARNVLAVSMEYDYDQRSQERWPVWGLRCRLMRQMRKNRMDGVHMMQNRLVGASFLVAPGTYALVKGFTPERGVDINFTHKLRDAVTFMQYKFDPVKTLDSAVIVNPSKELANLARGDDPESEWLSNDIMGSTNMGLRQRWAEEETAVGSMFFAEQVDERAQVVVAQEILAFFRRITPQADTDVQAEGLSQAFLMSLVDADIEGVEVHTSNGGVLRTQADYRAFLQRFCTLDSNEPLTMADIHRIRKQHWNITHISEPGRRKITTGEDLDRKRWWHKISRIRNNV